MLGAGVAWNSWFQACCQGQCAGRCSRSRQAGWASRVGTLTSRVWIVPVVARACSKIAGPRWCFWAWTSVSGLSVNTTWLRWAGNNSHCCVPVSVVLVVLALLLGVEASNPASLTGHRAWSYQTAFGWWIG